MPPPSHTSSTTHSAAGTRPHLLYVAWGYPPSRGGGVYRALATPNAFAAQGFDVTVLTCTEETFIASTGADYSLMEQIDPAIEVVRIPFPWPALETDVRNWSALRALAPRVWRRRQRLLDVRDFPEVSYGPWRRPLEDAALAIHRRKPVDLVVGTANPNVDFAAGDVLNRRYGIPYVMDYRDAWMLDVFSGDLLHSEGGRVDKLERDLLGRALEAWFVNEPIRAWHAQRHPQLADRLHMVANGYDPQFAPEADLDPPALRNPEAPLTFGYIGTASKKVPLAEFAAGWRLARQRPELADARAQLWGYLGFFALPNAELVELVEQYRGDDLTYCGPVPKQDVRATYATFDVLLLILGAGKYVTSGKVFEYTAAAKPIVSVHDPGNAATEVLRGYPLWFPVGDLEPESIADALAQAAHAARTADAATRQACADFAAAYSRDLQLAPRVAALRAAVTGSGGGLPQSPGPALQPGPAPQPGAPRSGAPQSGALQSADGCGPSRGSRSQQQPSAGSATHAESPTIEGTR
ncbi:glycosyltransferase involved in cell wall biosynthesis [Kineosphaera limosa]|uniref:D-inositol 3-phosphate glycosyltransferase n=1 Tax=Kineosphaera limosa NBRC 100340 TaxID=1184609 RepID=K6XE12_9MICO|nr:hypothetical protein [Kineosphaera limosa]NYE01973.1 glycosyltransferase involved in cell wall biosynthesis [Kineosphaera limosa]GAB97079.1 hypothetical protein KILIM_056_00030 [Kineosphaera limosa NBRC 100340]